MTLNQVINRIQQISLNHRQIRNFFYGKPTDFLTDKTTLYPSVFLQENGGSIDSKTKSTTFKFILYIVDLVHVSEDQKANETDVQSDCTSIGEDFLAEFSHSQFTDWDFSTSADFVFVEEEQDDMYAGIAINLSIRTPYQKDICQVPNFS
jgi:hypothetical protein